RLHPDRLRSRQRGQGAAGLAGRAAARAARDERPRDLRGRRRAPRLVETGGGRCRRGRRGGPADPPVSQDGLTTMGYADFLRKVPLFAELPDADLRRLCAMIKEVKLAPGETLFAEGDPGEEAYVIAEGEIEIVKISSGRDVLLAVRTAGDVIGEAALLEMAPRSATARARGGCKLLAIHKTLLDELVQGSA